MSIAPSVQTLASCYLAVSLSKLLSLPQCFHFIDVAVITVFNLQLGVRDRCVDMALEWGLALSDAIIDTQEALDADGD